MVKHYVLCNSEKGRTLYTSQMLFGGGVSFISLTDNEPGLHSAVMMAKLGILVAVAVFLETVSAASVSVTTVLFYFS